MKLTLTLIALLTATLILTGADGPSRVTYVDHDKVAAALAKGGVLITQSDLTVRGSHRDVPGEVEVHDKETDVIYVTDGEATFVTGGKMTGGKDNGPGQHLGSGIQGGETRHLGKGDVIVVAAGIPHWFKEVPHPISYYVVKVLKP
jgi:quercetin dioxygenase-like cupin family protein